MSDTTAELVDRYLTALRGQDTKTVSELFAEGEVRRSFNGSYPPLYQMAYMTGGLQLRALHHELVDSGKILGFPLPYSVEQMCTATVKVIRANNLKACYIRPLAFLGLGELGVYAPNNPVNVCIAVWPWGTYLGEDALEAGVRIKVSSWKRNDQNSLPPAAKASGQYINSILAKMEAIQAGYDEAVMLNHPHEIQGAGFGPQVQDRGQGVERGDLVGGPRPRRAGLGPQLGVVDERPLEVDPQHPRRARQLGGMSWCRRRFDRGREAGARFQRAHRVFGLAASACRRVDDREPAAHRAIPGRRRTHQAPLTSGSQAGSSLSNQSSSRLPQTLRPTARYSSQGWKSNRNSTPMKMPIA